MMLKGLVELIARRPIPIAAAGWISLEQLDTLEECIKHTACDPNLLCQFFEIPNIVELQRQDFDFAIRFCERVPKILEGLKS